MTMFKFSKLFPINLLSIINLWYASQTALVSWVSNSNSNSNSKLIPKYNYSIIFNWF